MNPSFAFFDLEILGPSHARSDECILRVWAKSEANTEYMPLVELDVNLRSLQFIGTTIDAFHHPLPENCVLLHLSDGIYTSFTDLAGSHTTPENLQNAKAGPAAASSSFDGLMQLANLDECVQDALKVTRELGTEANQILSVNEAARQHEQSLRSQKEQLSTSQSAIDSMRKQNWNLQRRIDEMRHSIKTRRAAMSEGGQPLERTKRERDGHVQAIAAVQESDQHILHEASGQMRRIGDALLTIFPIEAVGSKALNFTIRDIFLPNSTFDDTNRDEIAAALGFTAQLVQQLSFYLVCSLPYPLEANASVSWVHDPVSAGLAQRRYPLHPTSVAYKFEYGVFLLNKDIEFLMSSVGLRVLDIRHTLPNLKYLLYVLTAGSGGMPLRKAGGIRGLLGGHITPSQSRRASDESAGGGRDIWKQMHGNGGIVAKEKVEDPFAASPPLTKFTHRQSSLREIG